MGARKVPLWDMTPELAETAAARLEELRAELERAAGWLYTRNAGDTDRAAERLRRAANWTGRAIEDVRPSVSREKVNGYVP